MTPKLCVVFQLLLFGTQTVTTHMAYYKRKHSQGYFTAQLLILKNSSAVQCASACSLTDGCSVISYYRNQKLCKLSTQGGEYVADPAWTSLILRPHEQELDGQVSTTALVSHIIDETTATSSRTDKTFEISQAVTSRPSEFMNTGAVTSHSTDFTATAPRSFEFTTATETVTSHSTQFTEITGHVKSDLTELKTTVTSHTRRFTTSSETVTSDPRDLTTTTEAVTSDPTDLTTTAETVTSYQTGFTTSTEAVTPTYSTSQPMTSSGHDTPTTTSDVSECPHGYTMTSSGYCFMLLIPYHTFDQSSDICYQHSGFLASITSTVKNQEAVHMLQMRGDLTRDVMIGATDSAHEGTWRWLTGEQLIHWINGGPTNFHASADCLAYSFSNTWEWRDVICTRLYHALCEAQAL